MGGERREVSGRRGGVEAGVDVVRVVSSSLSSPLELCKVVGHGQAAGEEGNSHNLEVTVDKILTSWSHIISRPFSLWPHHFSLGFFLL
jgi:hypothetical protein